MDNTLDELNAEQTAEASIEENTTPALPEEEPEYTVDDSEYNDLSMYFLKEDTGLIDLFDEEEESVPADIAGDVPAWEDVPSEEEAPVTAAEEETVSENDPDEAAEEALPEQEDTAVEAPAEDTYTEAVISTATAAEEETVSEETENVLPETETEEVPGQQEVSEEMPAPEVPGEEEVPEGSPAGKKVKWPLIAAIVLLAGLLVFAGIRLFSDRGPGANVLIREGEVCNAGGIEITVDDVCVIGSLLTYPLDPEYTYVAVRYTFRNTGNLELSWESTPYMMLRPFVESEEGYVPVEAGTPEAEKLLSICGSAPDTSAAPKPAENGEEEDILSCVYGTFDYSALQIYSLNCGIDYSTVKDPLKGGESRVSADVFRIRKELFETGMYYICADNQNAVIYIDPEPVDVDVADPEASDDVQTGNGENAD